MTTLHLPIAIRAYAVPIRGADRNKDPRIGWRSKQFGERVVIFDAETTVDPYQNLLVASFLILERVDRGRYPPGFRVANHDPLHPFRGLVAGDGATQKERGIMQAFAEQHPVQVIRHGYARWEPMRVLLRDQFVHEVFFPEAYELGSLCVGYNLGFDLVRLSAHCTTGRKRNRESFRMEFCDHPHHPAGYLQIISNKQSFIRFASVPPPKGRKTGRGRVSFPGRFVDLRRVVYGLTGDAGDLESDCAKFGIESGKLSVARFGVVTSELIAYNIHDTEALTASLFMAVQEAYSAYTDIATEAPEFYRQGKRRITEIYSPATLGKAHLDAMGVTPPPLVVTLPDE